MIKIIKKYKIIFFIFVCMSLFYSLEISRFQKTEFNIIEDNNFFSNDSIAFRINSKINSTKFIEILNGIDINIELKYLKSNQFFGSAIYISEIQEYLPNIIEGRYFNLDDFKMNIPVAVIGTELLNYTILENDERYLLVDEIKYKVIGVMGGEDSICNDRFFINLNSYLLYSKEFLELDDFYNVDLKYSEADILEKLEEEILMYDKATEILKDSSLTIINPIESYIKNRGFYIFMSIIVFVVSTINITAYYINKRKYEMGVLKAVGIKNFTIIRKVICEFEILAVVSFIIGIAIHYVIYMLFYKKSVYYWINIGDLILVLLIGIVLGGLTCILPIIKILKIQPTYIIKR